MCKTTVRDNTHLMQDAGTATTHARCSYAVAENLVSRRHVCHVPCQNRLRRHSARVQRKHYRSIRSFVNNTDQPTLTPAKRLAIDIDQHNTREENIALYQHTQTPDRSTDWTRDRGSDRPMRMTGRGSVTGRPQKQLRLEAASSVLLRAVYRDND